MLKLLKRIRNLLAYTAAGLVILLAIMVGLFRLFLPRLTEYQEDIKSWATAAVGMQVEFTNMDARWRLSGPELNFYDAQLTLTGADVALIEAEEVTIGVGLIRLLVDRTLVVDRVLVSGTDLDFGADEDGVILVQGMTVDELMQLIPTSTEAGDVVFIGEDISVVYSEPSSSPLALDIDTIQAIRRDNAISIEARLDPGEGFGSRLDITADQPGSAGRAGSSWQVYVDGRSLSLARWMPFLPQGMARITSGSGDINLWLELSEDGIGKATANLSVDDVAIEGAEAAGFLGIDGRIEYSRSGDSLLLAAEDLSLTTGFGRWPESRLQLQLFRDDEGAVTEVNASASYLQLDDIDYFLPWLPGDARAQVQRFEPTGRLENVRASVTGVGTDDRRFDVAARALDTGIVAVDDWPGFRGFSGNIRADAAGGRLEFRSSALSIDLPKYLDETVILDDAIGTVIWRRSGEQLTVLTDRMRLRSTDVDSQLSLQVTIPEPGAAPVVDLDSLWSVNDVAAARRFLPEPVIKPALYRWLNDALVSGSMSNGTAILRGPLDRFPFEEGEGEFVVTARLENGVLDYARGWPAAQIRSMDVRLEGLRLFTERNAAVAAGNRTVNARVEIADLRNPVLTIDAAADGTLESIRQFAVRSPIANVFNGRLDGVRVDGDASFDLRLEVPINDRGSYSFSTRVEPADGTLELLGFPAPVSGLNGAVEISRDSIASEGLTGTFLGEPVEIELEGGIDENSGYSVVARAAGRVGAEGLIHGLRAPLSGLIGGSTDYVATVSFPRAGGKEPSPLRIDVASSLEGFSLKLPDPVSKTPDEALPLSLRIEFPEQGRLDADGSLGDDILFVNRFFRDDAGWDFDRGALAFGGEYPAVPGSRGLHIAGQVDEIRLAEWMALARAGQSDGPRFTDRIRAIELLVDDLYLFGQHLVGHRIEVDRSGAEWFVRSYGDQVEGTATIPYDLRGTRPVTLEMKRLILPGDETAAADAGAVAGLDPRTLPAISIRADEFAFGERFIGAVSADFEKTGYGLRADEIRAEDAAFTIEGSAAWFIDPAPGGEPEVSVSASLSASDVEQTLSRLGYEPVIGGENMSIDVDVSWPGGPRRDFLEYLSGEVGVRLGSGQLNEVEPGAGRVFGLMSIVELPRRLSLDFRDVFDKGFGFDEITGSFRIDQGDAYTCDLSLKGPAADIGITGRVGLAEGEYQQTALVSANVGNTLPVVGAVVAGPQVAAALLIFSQIFKKPIQEMGQVYYAIDGPFEDPAVEVADAERFALTSRQANCLADVE